MTSPNVMTTLTCETAAHGDMQKLIAQPSPPLGSAAFTLWICGQCGKMALHLETSGDIYWYTSHRYDHIAAHQAGCAYCQTRFPCNCAVPGQRHMCPGCDAAAEESKKGSSSIKDFMASKFPTPDPGEAAQDRAQTQDS